jgi:hypothetical protein
MFGSLAKILFPLFMYTHRVFAGHHYHRADQEIACGEHLRNTWISCASNEHISSPQTHLPHSYEFFPLFPQFATRTPPPLHSITSSAIAPFHISTALITTTSCNLIFKCDKTNDLPVDVVVLMKTLVSCSRSPAQRGAANIVLATRFSLAQEKSSVLLTFHRQNALDRLSPFTKSE